MFSQPQESLDLVHHNKPVAVMSHQFPKQDVNNFIVGSEEGSVFTACRHGSKTGVLDSFDGHSGPVTGIGTHAVNGPIDFSHIMLTSSFDWTIKMWNMKEKRLIYSFENNCDYVYDVAWSPIHPALFAAVDGNGRLDLWNLNLDAEVPRESVLVDAGVALNKVLWLNSGLQLAVADDMGKIYVYDVGEQMGLPNPSEWSHFVRTIQDLQTNSAEDQNMFLDRAMPPTHHGFIKSYYP